eukprot:6971291-Alexandrium_andersonii.AAC.1
MQRAVRSFGLPLQLLVGRAPTVAFALGAVANSGCFVAIAARAAPCGQPLRGELPLRVGWAHGLHKRHGSPLRRAPQSQGGNLVACP